MIVFQCPPVIECHHVFVCHFTYNACVWCGKIEGEDEFLWELTRHMMEPLDED